MVYLLSMGTYWVTPKQLHKTTPFYYLIVHRLEVWMGSTHVSLSENQRPNSKCSLDMALKLKVVRKNPPPGACRLLAEFGFLLVLKWIPFLSTCCPLDRSQQLAISLSYVACDPSFSRAIHAAWKPSSGLESLGFPLLLKKLSAFKALAWLDYVHPDNLSFLKFKGYQLVPFTCEG